MDKTPPISEDAVSVIPALHLLTRLGWSQLTPGEATALRQGRTAEVVLTDVLRDQLIELNRIETSAGPRALTDDEVGALLHKLTHLPDDGLVTTNEAIWTMLLHGADVSTEVDGRRGDHTLRFVDWDHPERNTWHVTEEFTVDRADSSRPPKDRRPDLVCFVNGLPFAVIECKRHVLPGQGKAVDQAISQHLRNQRTAEIPRLFHFAQVLLALSGSDAKYSVTGTPATHWGRWREQELEAPDSAGLLAPVTDAEAAELREKLAASPFRKGTDDIERALEALAAPDRVANEQDLLVHSLLTRERLLELVRRATIFEKGEKNERKMARYQQFFCMRKCLRTVERRMPDGRRAGGIVWHTQGSGKSLTMFLVAQRLLEVYAGEDARVVVVTDRNDLDEQILGTFQRVGAKVVQADSGRHLGELLHSTRGGVITTTVHKFEKFLDDELTPLDDPNVFVLVDEGHRTQSGSYHASVRKALPSAALIAFTGTP
ncbi:MAG: type I restriction endonuclease, partial [Planctomycetota bacterium]